MDWLDLLLKMIAGGIVSLIIRELWALFRRRPHEKRERERLAAIMTEAVTKALEDFYRRSHPDEAIPAEVRNQMEASATAAIECFMGSADPKDPWLQVNPSWVGGGPATIPMEKTAGLDQNNETKSGPDKGS